MFIPHVSALHRRHGKRPTRRQRLSAVAASVVATLFSAGIGVAFSRHSRADTIALSGVIIGLAFIGGIIVARAIGRRGKV